MSRPPIRLLQLYPRDMNIYGDRGNTQVLQKRLEWHGFAVELLSYDLGDTFPTDVDLVVGGGGQDSGQTRIQNDLSAIAPQLRRLAEDGVPMLMICGLYQLFGKSFVTRDGTVIQGIGIFNMETIGGPQRMIGNIVTTSEEFGQIVGYENHSGQTTLGTGIAPFGTVIRGAGNNGQDGTEGARYRNVIGSYLHGSLLPRNPQIADWLIEQAVTRRYGACELSIIDDRFADQARSVALRLKR